MFKKAKCLIALISILSLLPGLAFAEAVVGQAAPEFSATDSKGVQHRLQDFKGKTVVLEWTNAECPFVVKHYQTKNMQNLQKKYTEQGVVWLTINSSAPGKQGHLSGEDANAQMKSDGSTPTAYLIDSDGQIGQAYGAKTTPHMFVINGEGKVMYAGAIDDNSSTRHSSIEGATNYVALALDAVLKNEPVQVATTKAYGCSVKYAG